MRAQRLNAGSTRYIIYDTFIIYYILYMNRKAPVV